MNTNTTTPVPPYGEVVPDVGAPVVKHREVRTVKDPTTDKQQVQVIKTKIEHPSRVKELARAVMYYLVWMVRSNSSLAQ